MPVAMVTAPVSTVTEPADTVTAERVTVVSVESAAPVASCQDWACSVGRQGSRVVSVLVCVKERRGGNATKEGGGHCSRSAAPPGRGRSQGAAPRRSAAWAPVRVYAGGQQGAEQTGAEPPDHLQSLHRSLNVPLNEEKASGPHKALVRRGNEPGQGAQGPGPVARQLGHLLERSATLGSNGATCLLAPPGEAGCAENRSQGPREHEVWV
ncbi:unnamed protein product [Gadus morhua 'NCC']